MRTLVIGYGNTLCGDDGIGPWVADQITAWNWPEVRSLSVHQLTPELSADMAQVDQVFFIDAYIPEGGTASARLKPIPAAASQSCMDHLWLPNSLLSLTKQLYDAEPVAYHILIPGCQFEYGTAFSGGTKEGAEWSLKTIRRLLLHPCPSNWEESECMKLA
jgi:hydrogenase maturation protease